MQRLLFALLASSFVLSGQVAAPQKRLGELDQALTGISANSLRANLSFLASDALAGRWTPSPGLDTASEFIASRFRAAGLEPGNGESYFQVADLTELAKKSREIRDRTINSPILSRNVIGVLPGSDPRLKDTYVILSAHYDHLGTLATSGHLSQDRHEKEGDQIFNGANDDGSGTVSMIEVATALARMRNRPKRSIVFIAFCGEELGLLGSAYYTQHPLFPLKDTVAEINLEQVGRSDGEFGKDRLTMTGYDYTDLTALFESSARRYGMTMVKTKESDPYFEQSDNYNFAIAGVPDQTLATSYNFPDYHGLKDEWEKIDYPTMVKVDRLAARVIWTIANQVRAPQWNATNPKTAKYRTVRTPEATK